MARGLKLDPDGDKKRWGLCTSLSGEAMNF